MNHDINGKTRSRLGSAQSNDDVGLVVPTARKSRVNSGTSSASSSGGGQGVSDAGQKDHKYSIAIVGSGGVGKTCLTAQFANADAVFFKDYDPTVEGGRHLSSPGCRGKEKRPPQPLPPPPPFLLFSLPCHLYPFAPFLAGIGCLPYLPFCLQIRTT